MKAGLAVIALFVVFLVGIVFEGRNDGDGPASATPTATSTAAADQILVQQGDATAAVAVEIAATFAQRQVGLMNRREMSEDAGMLFLFPRDVQYGFWMKDTYLPLDIAYISASGEVVQIFAAKPLDETVLVPATQYRYVLEVNQGWFQRHSLGVGAQVTLPTDLPSAE
ncbi:MAG: DUF192 domain-containing protein [bacterium]